MSESDEWTMPPPWRPSSSTAAANENDMLRLRREALQREREGRNHKQAKPEPKASPRVSPSASPSVPAESELPLDFLASDPDDSNSLGQGGHGPTKLSLGDEPQRRGNALQSQKIEESVNSLRQKVAARKKVLSSLKEKEVALLEKYRSEKVHKKAELAQVEAKLRTLTVEVEDERRLSEMKIREQSDANEKELQAARRKIESELRDEFEPQVKAMQQKLEELQTEEKKLKQLLQVEGGTKDLVDAAVASATNGIIERLNTMFAQNAENTADWNREINELIRHEVRSSFSVAAGSEAEAERKAMKKHFGDMLEAWKQAEEDQKARVLKQDESLLSDIQQMAMDDLARLQSEELAMEEVYARSRDAWSEQHQKLLDAEQLAAFKRREMEFNEQRSLRNQLHEERMAFIEQRHRENMKIEESRHHEEMRLLREHFQREEKIAEDQQRAVAATQEEIKQASQGFDSIMESVEDLVSLLKEYHNNVEANRGALDNERLKLLNERESSLHSLKNLVVKQHTSTEAQHKELNSTLSQLASLSEVVRDHLHDEETWLVQQEASYAASRDEWDREHRRWKQLVENERQATEEKFTEALQALQDSIGLMQNEEREIQTELNSIKNVFSDVVEETEREAATLHSRKMELEDRHQRIKQVLSAIQQKSKETSSEYKSLLAQRQSLALERNRLREEAVRIRDIAMGFQLHQSKRQLRLESANQALKPPEVVHHSTMREGGECNNEKSAHGKKKEHLSSNVKKYKDPKSLPQQFIAQLEAQLAETRTDTRVSSIRSGTASKKKLETAHCRSKFVPYSQVEERNVPNPTQALTRHGQSRENDAPFSLPEIPEEQNTSGGNTFINLVNVSGHSNDSS